MMTNGKTKKKQASNNVKNIKQFENEKNGLVP